MAKNGKGGKGGTTLFGPLYTPPGQNLGPHKVEGPRGGMRTPDPIGLTHGKFATGPGAKSDGSQKHDKE